AESRAKVEELRQKLARFKGNKLAGKPSEKLPLLTGIVEEARALQYRPLEAEALRQLGGLHSEMGALEDARRTLLDAAFAAEAAGHTYEAEQAWAGLVWSALRRGRYEEGDESGKHALALVEHLGDDKPRVLLYNNLASLARSQGKTEEALHYQR